MTIEQALAQLNSYETASQAYGHAMSIIGVDSETAAPKKSVEGRGRAQAFFAEQLYRLTMAPEYAEALETILRARESVSPEEYRRAQLLQRELRDMTCVPMDEFIAWQQLQNEAYPVWHDAKENNDFASFAPYLEKIVAYQRRFAECKDPTRPAYDVLLDTYEKGLTMEKLDAFFEALRRDLTPVILAVKEKPDPDCSFLHGHFPKHEQDILSHRVMDMMGIDPDCCTLAETEHPFTGGSNKWDVRITTKYVEEDVSSSLYSVIHEGGHALYDMGVADEYQFNALSGGFSMSVHESQSRFYENLIGRSLPFCRALLPVLQELWPEKLRDVTPEMLYAAVNRAMPSLIRTEADELTYPMHIMVRYELEKQLIEGTLQVAELPSAWNEMYRKYLGITVPNDREGVLQDVHWAGGMMGYFPSYALGSAYGVQMLQQMEKDVDVWGAAERGDLRPITAWLDEKVHRHGSMPETAQLLEQSMGGAFDPSVYTAYLTCKFTELYHL